MVYAGKHCVLVFLLKPDLYIKQNLHSHLDGISYILVYFNIFIFDPVIISSWYARSRF